MIGYRQPTTGEIFCANYLLFYSASLPLNNAVCLSDLFMKSINDTLDMASYNSDKFLLSVTTVPKETVKIQVFDKGKPSVKAIDRLRSAYANAVITGLVRIMITYVRKIEAQMLLSQKAV